MASDFDKIIKMVENAASVFTEKKTLNETGNLISKQIVKRTKLGKGVQESLGPLVKLKILTPTKRVRKGLKKRGELDSSTQPAKANVTRTGKMLRTVHHRVIGRKAVEITVAPDQQDKAQHLEKLGIKWLNISKGEFKGLIEFLTRKLINRIK